MALIARLPTLSTRIEATLPASTGASQLQAKGDTTAWYLTTTGFRPPNGWWRITPMLPTGATGTLQVVDYGGFASQTWQQGSLLVNITDLKGYFAFNGSSSSGQIAQILVQRI